MFDLEMKGAGKGIFPPQPLSFFLTVHRPLGTNFFSPQPSAVIKINGGGHTVILAKKILSTSSPKLRQLCRLLLWFFMVNIRHDLLYNQGSREQLAIAEFANSLLVIPKTLAVNAAQDSAELVAKLRAYHNTSQINTERASFKWYVFYNKSY